MQCRRSWGCGCIS